MVWTINLVHRERSHGTQQHLHTTTIATNTATVIISDRIMARYLPNILIMLDHIEVSTPECSFNSSDMVLNLDKAFVKDPSGAMLLGIRVQQDVPNIEHTPHFSARSIFRTSLF